MLKRVLLILPTCYHDAEKTRVYDSDPPIGLASLAASVSEVGCEVKTFDVMGRDAEVPRVISDFGPDLIGLSCMTTQYPEFIATVEQIRNEVGYKGLLIAGGPHPTIEPEKTFKQLPLDACVVGEGERILQNLVRSVDLNNVKGLYTSDGYTGEAEIMTDLDFLPDPAYDLLELERYGHHSVNKAGTMRMLTARGCPYNCVFCAQKIIGNKLRFRSPERVVKDMLNLRDNYGYSKFKMIADTFITDIKWVRRFSELIKGQNITFNINARINLINDEMLDYLEMAGCDTLMFGVESAVQRVLNNINKALKIEVVEDVAKMCLSRAFKVHLFFMLSLPGETLEDMEETIKFAERMHFRYRCSMNFSLTKVFPGTPLARKMQLDIEDWSKTLDPRLKGHDIYANIPIYHELPLDKVLSVWNEAQERFRRRKKLSSKVNYAWRKFTYSESKQDYFRWSCDRISSRLKAFYETDKKN